MKLKDEAVAEILIDGWLRAMTHDAQPFVLNGRHRWLHRLAQSKLKDPRPFWKLNRMDPPAADEAEAGVRAPRRPARRRRGRAPGAPRRRHGQPRPSGVVALSLWLGGEVAREAKALTPSAWLWARGRPAKDAPLRYTEILAQAVRCPDPTLKCKDGWLMRRRRRRLAGRAGRPAEQARRREDVLGHGARGGRMHRRADKAEAAVAFLKGLSPKRLLSAAQDMLTALESDFQRFKAG